MTEQKMDYRALGVGVLAVAVKGAAEDWAVYIGPVKGYNHEKESIEVAKSGAKLDKELAEFLFPRWKGLTYRR